MASSLKEIEWGDISEAIPAFFASVFMAFSYSISYGIAGGFITYCIVKTCKKQAKDVHPVIWVVAVLSVFGALMMLGFLPFYMTAHNAMQWLLLLGIGLGGLGAEVILEPVHALRDGSLGDAELNTGARQAAMLDHRKETTQGLEIHDLESVARHAHPHLRQRVGGPASWCPS